MDIVLEGGLPVLIDMVHSADVETAHQGTGVVANLAEVVENQGKMVESGEEVIWRATTVMCDVFVYSRTVAGESTGLHVVG